jgi:hypothetical protein
LCRAIQLSGFLNFASRVLLEKPYWMIESIWKVNQLPLAAW